MRLSKLFLDDLPEPGPERHQAGAATGLSQQLVEVEVAPAKPEIAVVFAPSAIAFQSGLIAACQRAQRRQEPPVIAVWQGSDWPVKQGQFSTRSARRSSIVAQSCGVDAYAHGGCVVVELPQEESLAAAACHRLDIESSLGPVIVVLAGPWSESFLQLLVVADAVVAAGPADAVAACKLAMAEHSIEVADLPKAAGVLSRSLVRSGWLSSSSIKPKTHPQDEHLRTVGGTSTTTLAPSWESNHVASNASREPLAGESGQALITMVGMLLIALVIAGVVATVAVGKSRKQDNQRTVDLAALAAAKEMRSNWTDLAGEPAELTVNEYRAQAVQAAKAAAKKNGIEKVEVKFPSVKADEPGPLRVTVSAKGVLGEKPVSINTDAAATAELSPPVMAAPLATSGDEYKGPLEYRQGKPMRPDTAIAFDMMNKAATKAGHPLVVVSGYRSNAEQAALFAAHPDPKWVARPGTSLHRLGTELDLGPESAYGWLGANASRFGFLKRYSWEDWHFGLVRSPGSTYVAKQGRNPKAKKSSSQVPPWVPAIYRSTIIKASIKYGVSAALLSAQLKQESGFNPRAVSGVGAQGIAQFMPATAAGMGLSDPFDPVASIYAQARLMKQLLTQFGSVQLALAAYNAGPGNVKPCMCVPNFPETQNYVATIIALMKGYDPLGAFADALSIRLVK